jgi:hypothetical protein
MSSTSNLQSLLAYVFRPAYTWTGSNFTTTINLSNIDKFTANTVSYQILYIGDALSNVFIGSNAGNQPGFVNNCNALSNTAIGVLAANGITNSSNSVFVGYQAGLGALSNSSSIAIGLNAGYQASNISNVTMIGTETGYSISNASNMILMGTSNGYELTNVANSILLGNLNSSNLSNISNTISIGGNAGGTGDSNIYIGQSNGSGMTGSSNVFLGNGLNSTTVPATSSNTLLIGNGGNVLVAGNFSYGVTTIGTSNPSAGCNASIINGPTWGGSPPGSNGYGYLALDVAGWTRVSSGVTIGIDPFNPTLGSKFELDVSGHMRVSDGYALMTLSNYYSNSAVGATGLSNNTLFSITPTLSNGVTGTVAVNFGGPLTVGSGSLAVTSGSMSVPAGQVQSTGYYTVQGVTTSFPANTISTPYLVPGIVAKPGLIVATLASDTGNYFYTCSYIVLSLPAVEPTNAKETSLRSTNGAINITVSNTTIGIYHNITGSYAWSYNFTMFPFAP